MSKLKGVGVIGTIVSLLVVLAVIHGPLTAFADQTEDRSGRVEIAVLGQYQGSTNITSNSLGATEKFGSITSGGLQVGYNINDHFNVNMDLYDGTTSLRVTVLDGVPISNAPSVNFNTFAMEWNLDYNVLKTPITPVASGGVGFVNFTGSSHGFTASETHFIGNLGGGLRWDISKSFYLRALYRWTWFKLDDANSTTNISGPMLSIGYKF